MPRACAPYRAKTKGKVERPFRYVREDFFLGSDFRNLEDLNTRYDGWRAQVANRSCRGTTRRVVQEALEEGQAALQPLPDIAFGSVLKLERRVSSGGMVSVD